MMPGSDPTIERDIQLTLIDDSTEDVITVSQVPPSALPDSFRAETTLNIAGENWWVVEAEPTTRQEIMLCGALELRLRRIESVPSQGGVRFSLPTLCDALPPTDGPLLVGNELLLHEDDWRQIEWIDAALETEVQRELDAIRPLLEEGKASGDGDGFPDLHPRRGLHHPLASRRLSLDDLTRLLPDARSSHVAFETSSQTVLQSFAIFLTPSRALYGLVGEDSRLEVLGFARSGWRQHDLPQETVEALRQVSSLQDFLLADWCGARLARPGDALFETILRA